MDKIHHVLNTIIIIFSIYLFIDGIGIMLSTSGRVEGSNFGMLISIVNILAKIMVLFALKVIDMSISILYDLYH